MILSISTRLFNRIVSRAWDIPLKTCPRPTRIRRVSMSMACAVSSCSVRLAAVAMLVCVCFDFWCSQHVLRGLPASLTRREINVHVLAFSPNMHLFERRHYAVIRASPTLVCLFRSGRQWQRFTSPGPRQRTGFLSQWCSWEGAVLRIDGSSILARRPLCGKPGGDTVPSKTHTGVIFFSSNYTHLKRPQVEVWHGR